MENSSSMQSVIKSSDLTSSGRVSRMCHQISQQEQVSCATRGFPLPVPWGSYYPGLSLKILVMWRPSEGWAMEVNKECHRKRENSWQHKDTRWKYVLMGIDALTAGCMQEGSCRALPSYLPKKRKPVSTWGAKEIHAEFNMPHLLLPSLLVSSA